MSDFRMDFEKSIIELEKKIDELKKFTESKEIDFSEEIKKLEDKAEHMKKEVYEKLSPWQRMQVAKNLKRPRTLDYIQKVFDDFIPLHGDRLFRDDLHEVNMQHAVGDRVILYILNDGAVFFSANIQFENVGYRCVHDLHQHFFICHKVDLFFSAIHDTGHLKCLAMHFGIFFPYVLAKRTAQ